MRQSSKVRVAYLLTAVAAALACPEHAAATICVSAAVMWPAPLAPAAIDSHVWLTLASDWDSGEGRELVLRSARVTGAPAVTIPVLRRDTPGHRETTIELAPSVPLVANTRYEVWMVGPSHAGPPRFVSTFKTSAARDRLAPAWSGRVALERYFDPARRPGTIDVSLPSARTLWLTTDLATDDNDPAAPVLFGLWLADASGVFAYDRPAAAYLRQDPRARMLARPGSQPTVSLRLGGGGGAVDCDVSNFDIPADTRSLRVGVRALDLAGNATTATELTVKLRP
jgi:hypothetical protein